MHFFELQQSPQTLAEGVAEYYQVNPGLVTGRGTSSEAQEFFRCHDVVHVVFGCGTTLSLHESRQIYRQLARTEILVTALQSLLLVPRTLFRCLRQQRPWPWKDFDPYWNVSLGDIRQEFGICVAHRDPTRRAP